MGTLIKRQFCFWLELRVKKLGVYFLKYVFRFTFLLGFTFSLNAQLLISEIMASNASTLEDQFNNYPDWIEIYNAGTETVHLKDYWLSDDDTLLLKWNFPEMSLAPDSYTVVFASGKDINTCISYWHTVVNVGDVWRYFLPTSEIGDDWKAILDATVDWQTGKSGIGYGDNDDSTIIDQTLSYYMQKEFQLETIDDITEAAFYMDYDDGFVAYLNGTEIARSSNMGATGSNVEYNQTTDAIYEANMINGVDPESWDISEHIDILKQGSNILAIEVHNINSTSTDMSGIPFLLLGFTSYKDEFIFRNPYFMVKNVYPHTNFKISTEGESIYLSDQSGNVVDMIDSVFIPTDFSYGRVPGQDNLFGFYAEATPAEQNGLAYYNEYITDSVIFSSSGQNWDTYQDISLSSDNPEDQIRYTLDGSDPDEMSTLYTETFRLSKTSPVKARIFREECLPGPLTTRTFFVGKGHTLPVVSISMDPYDLWDENEGIYVLGPNAEEDYPNFGANFWQDWERPANVEIYNEEGKLLLSQIAGTKIFGGWTRAKDQRSMSFFARSKYGKGSFSARLFKEKPIEKFESFILRNDGNDWCIGLFRDGLTAHISAQVGIDHQAYQPYVMYLNGEYWGIINMREKISEHFLEENHDVYAEDINLLEVKASLVYGDRTSYDELSSFVVNNDMSIQSNYEKVKTMMDVDNYIRYWAMNVYIGNIDWPGHNIKYWSLNVPGSKYRWISYDTDYGFSLYKQNAYTSNILIFSLSEGEITWASQYWASDMMRALLANREFERDFINEFADKMNTYYHKDFMIPVVDSFQNRLNGEAPAHYDRWIGDPNNWQSYSNWLNKVEWIRTYLSRRPTYMRQHLIDRFKLDGTSAVELSVSDVEGGTIIINQTMLTDFLPFSGTYFTDNPILLEAIPLPGYKFSHWEGGINSKEAYVEFDMSSSLTATAVFEAVDSVRNIVINEINYSSSHDYNTEDWIELFNYSGVKVDLSGWSLMDGFSGEIYDIPDGTHLADAAYFVVARNIKDIRRFYPEQDSVIGDLGFGLNSSGDGIALLDPSGEIHDYVIFDSAAPWPTGAHGTGMTIELINPGLDNTLPENWKVSLDNYGTPWKKNSQFAGVLIGQEGNKLDILEGAKIYPTPFRESVTLEFVNSIAGEVVISVYSINGQLVDIIYKGYCDSGVNRVNWQPSFYLEAGVYLFRIKTGKNSIILKGIRN